MRLGLKFFSGWLRYLLGGFVGFSRRCPRIIVVSIYRRGPQRTIGTNRRPHLNRPVDPRSLRFIVARNSLVVLFVTHENHLISMKLFLVSLILFNGLGGPALAILPLQLKSVLHSPRIGFVEPELLGGFASRGSSLLTILLCNRLFSSYIIPGQKGALVNSSLARRFISSEHVKSRVDL